MELTKVITSRDGEALAKIFSSGGSPRAEPISERAEMVVNRLFCELKQIFPASAQTTLKTSEAEKITKNQWAVAFAENGIRYPRQLAAGLRVARKKASPFFPSPGEFIEWCRLGEAETLGLPSEDELFEMVEAYSKKHGLEEPRFESPACYWMVTALFSKMRLKSWTERDLLMACRDELLSMSKRISRGESLPEPKRLLETPYKPCSREEAARHIQKLKRLLRGAHEKAPEKAEA